MNTKEQYNLVELFSGIGSQYKALTNLDVSVKTLATSEWDVHAIVAYDCLYGDGTIPDDIAKMDKLALLEKLKPYTFSNSGKEALDDISFSTYSLETLQRIYCSIIRHNNLVDITSMRGSSMPSDIDILTYSFPCQDLSNVGALHGYTKGIDKDSGSRSSLLWQVGRILTEMKYAGKRLPRFLVMENVPSLLSNRHRPNFEIWISDLEKMGYVSKYYELNASSFGLPQNRPRLLMVSVFVGENCAEEALVKAYFNAKGTEDVVNDYLESKHYHKYEVRDFLRIDYENAELKEEAIECTPNDTVSRQKIWDENPQIVQTGNVLNESLKVVRTITTKQDRNPNSGNLYFESGVEGKANFRYLTPRECMLFMGFDEEDYCKLKKNNLEFHKGDALFSRDKIIRMAGNSIPVKLLEGIFLQVLQLDELLTEYRNNTSTNLFGLPGDEDYTARIRLYLYSHQVRIRDNNNCFAPGADLVYPKYKTAIYIREDFLHMHPSLQLDLCQSNQQLMTKIATTLKNKEDTEYSQLTSNGWNAIVLFHYDLRPEKISETLRWIESKIKENLKSKEDQGKVLTCG